MNINHTVMTRVICVDLKGKPTNFTQKDPLTSHAAYFLAGENTWVMSSVSPVPLEELS